jgi:hypothetical protein
VRAAVAFVVAVSAGAAAAQTGLAGVPPVDRFTCPASHPIKAVVTPRTKECIYQRPDDQHYQAFQPDLCFRTEDEARQEDCWRANEIL